MSDKLVMKELSYSERPYEKLERQGVSALSDAELLSIHLQSGVRGSTALDIANKMLVKFGGLVHLSDASLEEMQQLKGVGRVRAIRLKAAFELGNRRLSSWRDKEVVVLNSPQDIISLLEPEMRYLPREEFHILLLDIRHRLIRKIKIADGGLAGAVIFPRDVFREAVKANAAALVLAHNHPSGDAKASEADIQSTQNFVKMGSMMGIPILDHIIVASRGSISLREEGLM